MCSPAARGFLVDIKTLCVETGYLHVNGRPLSDAQIGRLIGETEANVTEWMAELGEAGAYSVDDEGLFFEDLVANAQFIEQARASGVQGGKARAKRQTGGRVSATSLADEEDSSPHRPVPPVSRTRKPAKKKAADRSRSPVLSAAESSDVEPKTRAAAPNKAPIKPLKPQHRVHEREWYETPAGWIRKAQGQAINWSGDGSDYQAFDELQIALCIKLPAGPHLDEPYLQKRLRKIVNARLPQAGGNFNKEVR
jgi:hypothetical protein